MPERVQKTKCRGCCGKKLRGDAGEGKEDKMRGGGGGGWCCKKNLSKGGGMPERVKKMKCGGGAGVGG